jgi:hypothetical protein
LFTQYTLSKETADYLKQPTFDMWHWEPNEVSVCARVYEILKYSLVLPTAISCRRRDARVLYLCIGFVLFTVYTQKQAREWGT